MLASAGEDVAGKGARAPIAIHTLSVIRPAQRVNLAGQSESRPADLGLVLLGREQGVQFGRGGELDLVKPAAR